MIPIIMILIVPDLIVSLAISVGFSIPNFLIVATMMIPNANDASASKVLYPSKKPLNKACDWYCLLIGASDMPPNGWIKANNKIIANNTKNTGFKIYRYILKFLMAFSQKPCNHKDEAKNK